MYTLYYSQGACSLATQVVLHELELPVEIIDKNTVENFHELNPAGTVPVLVKDGIVFNEGAAVMLHILGVKENTLLPQNTDTDQRFIEAIMFANATMHPAYGKLFFGANAISDEVAKQAYFEASAAAINKLWAIVNERIGSQNYLFGNNISPADIMLAVYSTWGQYFPVDIKLGENTERMIKNVQARESYKKAVAAEAKNAAKAA